MEQTIGQLFTWCTSTNVGPAEICMAALRVAGIDEDELSTGYLCDPASKSPLRILARAGIKARLTRNFDKQRGIVIGAAGTVCELLHGNAETQVLIRPERTGQALHLNRLCARLSQAGVRAYRIATNPVDGGEG